MSEWAKRHRQYGPHCRGNVIIWEGEAPGHWNLRYEQLLPGVGLVRLSHGGTRPTEAKAQAACNAQVAAWQKMFPMLEIVANEQPTKGQ